MIEFLQDYTTKALPPETFRSEDRVTRSDESELYFVRLGVAAYVTADGLVDVDHRPLVRVAVPVVAVDPRSLPMGRAGELALTVAAPARASTGPGNEVLFGGGGVGGDQQTAALTAQIEQFTLSAETDALERAGLVDANAQLTAEIGGLKQAAAAHADREDEAKALAAKVDDLNSELSDLRQQGQADAEQIKQLTQQLADARSKAATPGKGRTPAPDEQA